MEYQQVTQSAQKDQQSKNSSSLQAQPAESNQTAAHPLLRLQQAVGNQAVQNMMRSGGEGLQARSYEPRSLALASPTLLILQRKCACGGTAGSGGECAECRAERLAMQRDSSTNSESASTIPSTVHSVLKSPGQPLSPSVRNFMEPRFGQDFSRVRVHTDAQASKSAQAVNALAYTVGPNIVFGSGSYAPEMATGKKLLAHELTHVVQQSSGLSSMALGMDRGPADPLERAADQQASAVTSMNSSAPSSDASAPARTVSPARTSIPQVQRQINGGQAGSQPPPDRTVWERIQSQIKMLERMYNEQRYGCWCGPGNVCEEERDNIDACCKRHDLAYDALGVSGDKPGPGQVGMWSIEGFRRTVLADLTFVACLELTAIDWHFYGPAAAAYRSLAQFIFSARALIGAWIIVNIPIPTIVPMPMPVPVPVVGPSSSNAPQQPLASVPDREVPMLSQEVAQQARDLISQSRNADALQVIVNALITNGFINASLCHYSYVAKTDQGEGLTNTKYKKDPAGTGQFVPDGLSEVEIYTPAYSSLSWLVSSIMHEYQHVLQHQKVKSPESFKEPKSSEETEANEVEAYLWEIEHAEITGLIDDIPQLWRVANRLTNHYNTLGALNKDRQETYRVRYEAAMQFMQDLMGDDPPPLPPYQNIFHHGTDMDTANRLQSDDIEPLGGDDFGRGFYTHTRENWMKAREWAVQRARKLRKPGWGVVTFPVPDDIWEEEIFVALVFKNRFDRPGNAPINPETGQPMSWKEFVRYNKTHKDPLPEWKEFQIIQGPFWGPRISKSQLRQVIFTSTGVPVLNRGDVKELRMAVIRKFRR